MKSSRLIAALFATFTLLAALLLPAPTQAAPVRTADQQVLAFSVKLKAKYKDEHGDGTHTYGVTFLKGKTKINKQKVTVERDSVYQYVNGAGPISGFLTLDWKGPTTLGFNVSGQSEAVNGTTVISANLVLFEAEGDYQGYTGFGTMTGTRTGKIGSPVTYTFNITLSKP